MSIDRRQLLTAGAGLMAFPLSGLGRALSIDSADSYYHQFHRALQQRPWLSAYQSVKQHSYSSQAKISGVWPADLRGTLYRNGPAQHETHGPHNHRPGGR